ncbi:hypothetical protein [Streptococcus pneumoniae]|nr:hypothetical protein [Streptococcus pneumoniae]
MVRRDSYSSKNLFKPRQRRLIYNLLFKPRQRRLAVLKYNLRLAS